VLDAFDVVKRLCDPQFRHWLGEAGYVSGMEIHVARPGETDGDVQVRMSRGAHLLLADEPGSPFGLRARVVAGPLNGPDRGPSLCDRTWEGHSCYGLGEHECSCCCGAIPPPR
jgi:hypothetical protein